MSEFHGRSEISETQKHTVENFKEIKPEFDITLKEAKSFVEELFGQDDGYYKSYGDRIGCTPHENTDKGSWKGERGESKFIPSDEREDGKAAKEKLAEKGMDGIKYDKAEPDFSECSEETVQIDNMTENRYDYIDDNGNIQRGNFSQADIKCADQWNTIAKEGKTNWVANDVRDWRREKGFSWHERCDTKKMDLVPREIHSYFTHSGGVAECKARDGKNFGGGFDE
jgi:hypothetical protein